MNERQKPTSENNGCLTKADLVDAIYDNLPLDKQKATQIVEDWIEIIKEGLARDEKVMISGFGVFEVKSKHARPGRNPQTGDRITLAPRNVVKFKPSQILRKDLNEGVDPGGASDEEEEEGAVT